MEDFPAGPACPKPRGRPLSVVIPVHNGGRDFERCLRGLRDSDWSDFELIVVDDGSTDGSGELAEAFGARLIRHEHPTGPAAARNAGALAASSPIIFFVDADVVVHPETLGQVLDRFQNDPKLAALFGSYDDRPSDPGRVSQFRNLLHHYVHQQGHFVENARPAHTFWTGCGAIRREIFLDLGGFDPSLYRRPAIEDIELGYRLTRAGHSIALVRSIQATHLKRWTLASMLRTDLFQRGVPWMLLMLRSKVAESDLNVSPGQRVCVGATGLGLLGLLASPVVPAALAIFALNLLIQAFCNRDFYRFLAQRQGWPFLATAFPLHYLYFCSCGLSVVIAVLLRLLPNRRREEVRPLSPLRRDQAESSTVPRPRVARAQRKSRWTKP